MKINNQKGIALLFVMTAIALLTIILADFSFETHINKLRSYNSQDQLQARLNAEAGLKLALIRLELYQQARNLLEKNKSIKKAVKVEDLNQFWNIPFIYPMPVGKKTKLALRAAIEKFMENSLLEGEILTEIKNVSHLINLNLLRLSGIEERGGLDSSEEKDEGESKERFDENQIILNLESRLIELFQQKFDRRLEDDDDFAQKYSNIRPEMLIKEIKFYINDANKEFGPEIDEIRAQYISDGLLAKYAPFESLSELYLLRGWDDELVDMIKNEVTVHGVVVIDLNQITEQGLRLLIPEIDEQQVKDFFEYRDDPESPHFFNNIEEFKNYVVNTAHIVDRGQMDQRISEFMKAGIEFGVYGSLFQIISTGRYRRSEYTFSAFVEIPVRPIAPKRKEQGEKDGQSDFGGPEKPSPNPEQDDREPSLGPGDGKKKERPPRQFLSPRIVEMTVY